MQKTLFRHLAGRKNTHNGQARKCEVENSDSLSSISAEEKILLLVKNLPFSGRSGNDDGRLKDEDER